MCGKKIKDTVNRKPMKGIITKNRGSVNAQQHLTSPKAGTMLLAQQFPHRRQIDA